MLNSTLIHSNTVQYYAQIFRFSEQTTQMYKRCEMGAFVKLAKKEKTFCWKLQYTIKIDSLLFEIIGNSIILQSIF